MQYVLLSDKFGGINTYLAADRVGFGGATDSYYADVTAGTLRPRFADVEPTLNVNDVWSTVSTYVPANSQTIVPWDTGALGMTGRYAVARFGGKLYRSHRGFSTFPSDLDGIQYTSNIGGGSTPTLPTWDYLGLMKPAALGTVTDSTPSAGAGVPAGTITYYCTFYNADGQESPPATSTDKVITAAKKLTITLPQSYGTCTVTGGSNSLTAVTNIDSFRLGMRITGTNIPANTYITVIDKSNPSNYKLTISQNASGSSTTTNVKIIDAQVAGTRLYRMGGGIDIPLLVAQTPGLTTATYADEKTNAQLGEAITTIGTADMPSGLRDVAVTPSGVLLCASPGNTVTYFSLVTPSIYKPSQVIKVSDSPLTIIYALNRFICPTIRGAFTVTIDDAVVGLPIIQIIEDTEPCQVSYNVYAVDVGGAVWWNTNKGIVQTDGNTIQTVTKFTFKKETVNNFVNCYGAEYYNNDYYALLQVNDSQVFLFKYNQESGWVIFQTGFNTTAPGAIGYHINDGCIVFTGTGSPRKVTKLEASSSRRASASYSTGEWVGEKFSSLKKFRKISAVFKGDIQIQAVIDGITYLSVSKDNGADTKRISWWLPSGAKGRSIYFIIYLNSSAAEIEELGIWVGEQREPMP